LQITQYAQLANPFLIVESKNSSCHTFAGDENVKNGVALQPLERARLISGEKVRFGGSSNEFT